MKKRNQIYSSPETTKIKTKYMKQSFSITVHQPRMTHERRTNEENRKIALTYYQELPGHNIGRDNPGRARQSH